MNAPITVEHNGIVITYNEAFDRWEFTLRNRERSSGTLAKAKEAINKPPPEPKKQFNRIDCWAYSGAWDGGWKKVTVTSVSERGCGSPWVRTSQGNKRSKERARDLFPCGSKNDPLVGKLTEIEKQIAELRDQTEKIKLRMVPLNIPDEEEES